MGDKNPEKSPWLQASGESFVQIREIKETVKNYSYQDIASSHATDEKLCESLKKTLYSAKKRIYSISDLLFSLQIGEGVLPLTDTFRDEIDILSDEIQVRHCTWKPLTTELVRDLIRKDLKILKGVKKLDSDLDKLFRGILEETNKSSSKQLWEKVTSVLNRLRFNLRELVILFKEREALCNLKPISLEKTFKMIQKEIREKT